MRASAEEELLKRRTARLRRELSRTDHEGAIGWLLLAFVSLAGIYKKSC
jgi:hypothetical protein